MKRMFLWLVLVVAGLWGGSAWATVLFHYDFEDGVIPPGQLNPNLIPVAVVAESGNHYLHVVASPSDCGPSFATTCPRTRNELHIGDVYNALNTTVTFSFRIRWPSGQPTGQNAMFFQLFNPGVLTGGRTVWMGFKNERVVACNKGGDGSDEQCPVVDLGPIVYDQYHDYRLVIFLTVNDAQGRADIYRDNVLVGSVTGLKTMVTTDPSQPAQMYLDGMDFFGVLVDNHFDNVQISTGSVASNVQESHFSWLISQPTTVSLEGVIVEGLPSLLTDALPLLP